MQSCADAKEVVLADQGMKSDQPSKGMTVSKDSRRYASQPRGWMAQEVFRERNGKFKGITGKVPSEQGRRFRSRVRSLTRRGGRGEATDVGLSSEQNGPMRSDTFSN